MSTAYSLRLDERSQKAVAELQDTILARYPTARFEITRAPDDARILHIIATVDVDDPDEVGDLVIDRVAELVAEEGLPIHVIPVRTPERIEAELRNPQASTHSRGHRKIPLLGRFPLSH